MVRVGTTAEPLGFSRRESQLLDSARGVCQHPLTLVRGLHEGLAHRPYTLA